jgi:hypothetical protein
VRADLDGHVPAFEVHAPKLGREDAQAIVRGRVEIALSREERPPAPGRLGAEDAVDAVLVENHASIDQA